MKKNINKIIIIVISILFVSYTFIMPSAASKAKTIKELRNELQSLKNTKKNNENKKNKTQSEINSSNQSITNARNEITENQNKIEQSKKDIEDLNIEITNTKESIKNTISAYQITEGQNVYLEYIFEAASYEDLVYRYAIVEQILDYNNEQIDKFNNLIKENEQLQIDLAEREIELNNQIDSLSSKIDELGNQLEEITEHTMDIQDEIDSTKELIDYYVKLGCGETQNLNECVSIKGDTSFSKPLTKGTITSYFGYRINPLTGTGTKFHSGVDIGGNKEGTNVYASANGMVGKIIRKASCGGNQVYVYHTINGVKYTSSYWHLLSINVSIGDKVDVNTVVGTVGGGSKTRSWDSCSTGAHLHYMIAKGWYGETYTTYSKFLSNTLDPKEILKLPNKGTYWYSR
ncbi:MAG: peptidoglycan DD-metalloendopeptidase family protein [Bacilli bacterium]|nr:peptidoglycan DD-metalloendopeptidase family protein [Bacilli bacterium]